MDSKQIDKKIIKEIPSKPLKFLLYASKPHKWWALAAFSAMIIGKVGSQVYPYVFGRIIDAATQIEDITTVHRTDNDVAFWLLVMVSLMVLWTLGYRGSGLLGMKWITKLQASSHEILFRYLSLHSHKYFSDRFAGSITNKAGNVVSATRRFAEDTLWYYSSILLSFIITGVLIFITNLTVWYIYITLLVVLLVGNYYMMQYRKPYTIKAAKERSELRGQAVDAVGNIQSVRQFARRLYELTRLRKQIDIEKKTDEKDWFIEEMSLLINAVFVTAMVGVMFIVTYMSFASGAVTLGEFVMIMTFLVDIFGTMLFIGNAMSSFTRKYSDSLEGLTEIVVPHDILDTEGAAPLVVKNAKVEFKNVRFAYSDGSGNVFKNLSFIIESNQKVGIVGSSGAGKTTLVSLLLRQQDIGEGSILVDDTDIRMVTQDSLREAISLIPQDTVLFHRSLRENIRYGDLEATDEQVEEAAKLAQAHDFIMEAPEGYETEVGERGIKLSGGQRQRVAIARAMLKDSPILILDEATSALDSASEIRVQQALHELVKGKTVLAIAHRLSTLREMDRIIVLDKGEIVQDGSHEELLKDKDGVYATLWSHQAGGFLQDE